MKQDTINCSSGKTSSRNHQRLGFTLVEVVVSIALFAALVVVVSSMYSFVRRTFVRVDGKSVSSSDIERFLLRLDGELRSATDVTNPPLDERGNRLNFYNKDGNEIGYELTEDGEIIRTEYLNDSQRVIMSNTSNLSFSRYSRGLVEISITAGQVSVLTAVHVWNLP